MSTTQVIDGYINQYQKTRVDKHGASSIILDQIKTSLDEFEPHEFPAYHVTGFIVVGSTEKTLLNLE